MVYSESPIQGFFGGQWDFNTGLGGNLNRRNLSLK
jgi:hypothetical protein